MLINRRIKRRHVRFIDEVDADGRECVLDIPAAVFFDMPRKDDRWLHLFCRIGYFQIDCDIGECGVKIWRSERVIAISC